MHIEICVYVYVCIYIYIYIERERKICMYIDNTCIYIYIHVINNTYIITMTLLFCSVYVYI